MKRILLTAPAVFYFALAACSAEVGQTDSTGAVEQAAGSCSALYGQCGGQGWTGATCCAAGSVCTYSNAYYSQCLAGSGGSSSSSSSSSSGGNKTCTPTADPVARAAATVAYHIMVEASNFCANSETGNQGGPCYATDILASQRYRIASGGAKIEFDPNVGSYGYISAKAKSVLAVAQLNATLASYLVGGLKWAMANTDSTVVPNMMPIQALRSFTYPGNSNKIYIYDGAAGGLGRRFEVLTGTPWDCAQKVHVVDTTTQEANFAALNGVRFSDTSNPSTKAGYTGHNAWASTPFNGPNGDNNPSLIISGFNWKANPPTGVNCGNSPCTDTIDIDPVPYTLPDTYVDGTGAMVGPQSNPFADDIDDEYADAAHQGQWGTRVVNGTTQWGTYDTVTDLGDGFLYYAFNQQY